jgi:hypothetical protein
VVSWRSGEVTTNLKPVLTRYHDAGDGGVRIGAIADIYQCSILAACRNLHPQPLKQGQFWGMVMGKYLIAWLLGVPISVLVIIYLIMHL